MLPARHQALLLLRVLAYDRALPGRTGEVATVGVVYRPGDRSGEARRDALLEALREAAATFSVRGIPVKVVAIPWSPEQFAERLRNNRAAAALLVGMGVEEAAAVTRITRKERVLSLSEDRAVVDAGVAVGLIHRGRRAGVVVNLAAARAEGADLEAELLAVAEVH